MAKAEALAVSAGDRRELEGWRRSRSIRKSWADRARVILLSAQSMSAAAVGERIGMVPLSVYKWRARYRAGGIEALRDRPRSGQPRKLGVEKAKQILDLTVHGIPREATHWSVRLMAKYTGVTKWQVVQVWKAADLRPHRVKNFKISNDPKFAEKVEDVVGLYLDPPVHAVVLSVDEKTQIQALDRTQPELPLRPGGVARRTHDYRRHGTLSLYAAFDVATGKVLGRITQRHRAQEFLAFLKQIDRAVAPALDIHMILDNSSTHNTQEVREFLARRPRFQLHFTPTSASWLNAVESFFSQLETRCVRRGTFTSVAKLREALRSYLAAHNDNNAKPFKWTKSAASIVSSVRRAKSDIRTNQTGH